MNKMESRVRLEVDLAKVRHNFETIAGRVAPGKVISVLKANAYGLGVRPIAGMLASCGSAGFAVAEVNEALELIDLGLPVRVLGNLLPAEIAPAVEAGLVCPVGDLEGATRLSAEAEKQRRNVRVQLAIDTGMGRLGILAANAVAAVEAIAKLPRLELYGIFCHCPVAYNKYDEFTVGQIVRFKALLSELADRGFSFKEIHMAASDAINNFPEAVRLPFNRVRAGINLYGYCDNEVAHTMDLRGVVTLKTRLAAVRTLPAGTTIGYGRTYALRKPTRVGTIAAGYADGLPLALSNRGYVLLNGAYCPVLGRLSMDYTTILLDHVPEAQCGDEVVCIGEQNGNSISLEEWAQLKGTHAYELLCSIGTRVERVYKDDGERR
ncbi:MAG: alanine racemase [Victivallaceae bacterium]|nr:alanine racemase [Victivallaceae bacterium]